MASYEPLHDSTEWGQLSVSQRLARYAVCYVAWAGFVGLGVLAMTWAYNTYQGFWPLLGQFFVRGTHNVVFIIIVVILLSYVLFMEHYLRRGTKTGRLKARIIRGALWMVPIAGALYVASVAVPALLG